MGTDYNLKKIYEQMLKGTPECSEPTAPRTLNEAYKQVLVERTAFYSKDIGTAKDAPEIPGLQALGALETPEKIKHVITSLSLKTPLEELLKLSDEAGKGWHRPPVTGVSLEELGKELVERGITGNVLSSIIQKKDKLRNLEAVIVKRAGKDFNFKNVILHDLVNKHVAGTQKELNDIFDYLFTKTASIGLASVGWGEIAATMLTNAKKGETGDLIFPSGTVEVKATDGRLGKAGYAAESSARDLAAFLKNLKPQYSPETQTSSTIKRDIRDALEKIAEDPNLKKTISPDYFNIINGILILKDLKKLPAYLEKTKIMSLTIPQVLQTYLYDSEPEVPVPTPSPTETSRNLFRSRHKYIREKIKALLSISETNHEGENILDPSYIEKQNYNKVMQTFFLHDIGLTYQQAAEAFTKHAKTINISDEVTTKVYGPAIEKYFQENYESMKSGNLRKLHAIIFAYSLALYAKGDGSKQHFNYLLMVSNNPDHAMSIDVTKSGGDIIREASDIFNTTSNMSLSIRADERGGSAISYKG